MAKRPANSLEAMSEVIIRGFSSAVTMIVVMVGVGFLIFGVIIPYLWRVLGAVL